MRILDLVTLNQLRIFESVYRSKSMTKTAEEQHLTQSGISQHIKTLEETLGVQLFDRIRQKLVPTAAARFLFEACSDRLQELELALQSVSSHEDELQGEIHLGVPAEFGINVIVPLVAKFMRQNSKVTVHVKIELADAMNELLLNGEVDFAFVDDFKMDTRIEIAKVYDEHLELCCSPKYLDILPEVRDRKFFESLGYIAYKEDLPLIQNWFQHHYKMRRLSLKVKAAVGDVLGVARFITEGIGVGILPRHNIRKLQRAGEVLHIFPTSQTPLVNTISVAVLQGRSQSTHVQRCRGWLIDQLKSLRADLEDIN